MAYCVKCGTKNEDDATFCKNCGTSLTGAKPDYARDRDKRCEEECAGGKGGRGWMVFWGVIIILSWVTSVQWNWIFSIVIAIFIIIFGLRLISRH
jgi:uncharacterized membrane protein YvbJ